MLGHLPFIIITGLILGLEHALEPDHLVAVSVFVSERRDFRSAARLGISWGLGHTTTLLLIGGGALLLNLTIPPWLAESMELLVGVLLIGIGLHALYRVFSDRLHLHQHQHHDGADHRHFHAHRADDTHHHIHQASRRAFLVGLLHGGAGSAAAVILVLSLIEVAWQGILLILLFGVGSIVGMMLASLGIAFATRWTGDSAHWQRTIRGVAGSVSVALGCVIAWGYVFAA